MEPPQTAFISYQNEQGLDYTWQIDARLEYKAYAFLVRQGYVNIRISRV